MSMELINNMQSEILEHLGRFGFLTVSQFHVLTGKSLGYIREMLGSLSRRGYIKSYRIEISYKVRAENVYFLQPFAVDFLQTHKVFAAGIKYPLSKNPVVTKDYWHRQALISVQIHFYKYTLANNIPLTASYAYFDKIGSVKAGNLTAKTAIPLEKGTSLIADGAMITHSGLYLLEMYCDKDSKRIIHQLGLHARAITLGTPAKAFGVQDNPLVLSVFAHSGIKQAVVNKLSANTAFTQVSHLYFFATLDNVKQDIGTAFTDIYNNSLQFK